MLCCALVLQVILSGNNKTNTDALNKCDINGISGPDNLDYANGNLVIAEDTALHFNNYLWAYNLKSGEPHSLPAVLRTSLGCHASELPAARGAEGSCATAVSCWLRQSSD